MGEARTGSELALESAGLSGLGEINPEPAPGSSLRWRTLPLPLAVSPMVSGLLRMALRLPPKESQTHSHVAYVTRDHLQVKLSSFPGLSTGELWLQIPPHPKRKFRPLEMGHPPLSERTLAHILGAAQAPATRSSCSNLTGMGSAAPTSDKTHSHHPHLGLIRHGLKYECLLPCQLAARPGGSSCRARFSASPRCPARNTLPGEYPGKCPHRDYPGLVDDFL